TSHLRQFGSSTPSRSTTLFHANLKSRNSYIVAKPRRRWHAATRGGTIFLLPASNLVCASRSCRCPHSCLSPRWLRKFRLCPRKSKPLPSAASPERCCKRQVECQSVR